MMAKVLTKVVGVMTSLCNDQLHAVP